MVRRADDLFLKRGSSRDLIVMIHGFSGGPSSFDGIRRAIEEVDDLSSADLFAPAVPFTKKSRVRPADAVASLVDRIDKRWSERSLGGSSYERIYLIGHSMGGLFIRKAYVCAAGSHADAPIEEEYDLAFQRIGAESCEFER